MARNLTTIDQIVGDFLLTRETDDYTANSSEVVIRNFALRGMRDIGFDLSNKIRSLKLDVNTANNTVELPDDFVGLNKLGIVGTDGKVYVFTENKNINKSQSYANSAGTAVGKASEAADSDSDGVYDRVDDTGATQGAGTDSLDDVFESFVFRNFVYGTSNGRLYGIGGGNRVGYYRLNQDQGRIELDTSSNYTEVVIEYVADEARSSNPTVPVFAEEALRTYIYYKLIERKSNVPLSEKQRARSEYYNERRLAKGRLSTFTKEDALQVIKKNFRQSPKV